MIAWWWLLFLPGALVFGYFLRGWMAASGWASRQDEAIRRSKEYIEAERHIKSTPFLWN
jgi:hypothetical protein